MTQLEKTTFGAGSFLGVKVTFRRVSGVGDSTVSDLWNWSGKFSGPIVVTEITPTAIFYRAEKYHQRSLEKRGLASCHVP
jgi:peptide methionine sulfoxide reductase MsrA